MNHSLLISLTRDSADSVIAALTLGEGAGRR